MTARIINAEQLKEILHYDPSTGVFTWIKPLSRRTPKGSTAGNSSHGYTEIGIRGKSYRAHHLAWLYVYGVMPTQHIDHIDGNRSNNAITNLREVTNQENSWNRYSVASNKTTSDLLGVTWNKQRQCWQSQIKLPCGRNKNLGLYDSEEDAHVAYLHAKRKYHPTGEISKQKLPPLPPRRNLRRVTSAARWISYDSSRHRWCAKPRINGKYQHVGYFHTESEAIAARDAAIEASKTKGTGELANE